MATDSLQTHEIVPLSSRIAYQNPWLRVREDIVRRADGSEGLYGVVERAPFVVVAAWQDGCLTLVEQYRYPVRRRLWEFPMGTVEGMQTADPAELAAIELREETGLVAENMQKVGDILEAPGFCTQRGHVFLATGLQQGPPAREISEQGMECRPIPLAQVESMVRDGTLVDGMTLAALGLLRIHKIL